MKSIDPLLAFIRQHESRNNYDCIWSGIKKSDYPSKPLTQMTVREVLDWQHRIDHQYRSEAAGAYQIMEDTLRELMDSAAAHELRLSVTDPFDAMEQDKLATLLLRKRGLTLYAAGWNLSAERFCFNLAKEWASLPLVSGPRKGHGYYDGDGMNQSNADPDEFLKIVRDLR